jgi:methenyltetrahydrofolate cyclohydrolase
VIDDKGNVIMLGATTTIQQFLEATAARQPTPGGGSVAALGGALAAAMGEMVLNFSVGQTGSEAHGHTLQVALGEFHRARQMMLQWMSEDQSAYESLTAARKLPAHMANRQSEIDSASRLCIEIPQAMAATAVEIVSLAAAVSDIANVRLLSDLAICAELAMATTRSAIYNMRVNLPSVTDRQQRQKIEDACQRLDHRATGLIQQVMPKIWNRILKQG